MDHQGLEVTEVKEDLRAPQDIQDSLALLAHLVLQVHAVMVGPSSMAEKNLVVLPHFMEMNQWISKSTLKRL